MKKIILLIVLSGWFCIIFSQTYVVDANVPSREIKSGHLKMGDPGPVDKEIKINNLYMTLADKPIIPVMGEIHFSRYPKEQWEDVILKMKANGINIIASYVFWIHHEEIEGQFDWSGNKDLRTFVKLCQKHDMWVYPRIGPWCHGEVRNGGTPDWILKKKFLQNRINHPVYQNYVDRLYSEIAQQLKGLLYKDGGPVVGIQFENEYWRGQKGEAHILWLKQTARNHGLDVPLYTVTGWQGASVPKDEVIPLWGGYPAEPWATHTNKIETNSSFSFEAPMNDETIGSDLAQRYGNYLVDYTRYPYFTCELGIGNQLSEHRRPIINRFDGLAIATIKIGSGSNMPGYYVFAGGINPVGVYTTLEENQDETGSWNQYPDISYDFQTAIRETGELAPSYHQIKKLHYFLNEFGSMLAPMLPVISKNVDAKQSLQYAVRTSGNSAFVFGLNYYRGVKKVAQKNVQFEIRLANENITFPTKAVDVSDSSIFIWPVNFEMEGTVLKYATAQPLCRLEQGEQTDWFFIQTKGVTPEFAFDASTIQEVDVDKGEIKKNANQLIISNLKPGLENVIRITTNKGTEQRVVILPYEESDKIWLLKQGNKKMLFLSDVNLFLDKNRLHIYGVSPDMKVISFNKNLELSADGKMLEKELSNGFVEYKIQVPGKDVKVELKKRDVFDDASWLKVSMDKVEERKALYHKLFIKEFNLGNPSPIKSAVLYLMSETKCKIESNNIWVNQNFIPGELNEIDLTGYLQKGENELVLDFPYVSEEDAFAAKIEIDYFNSDQIEIFSDSSWQTTGQYTLPAPWSNISNLTAPDIVAAKVFEKSDVLKKSEWRLSIPDNYLDGLNDVFLHIDYTGDKGRCRLGYKLVSDNFNNGTSWLIELKRFGSLIENNELEFELFPLEPDYKIYFEKEPAKEEVGKTGIKNIEVVPEYTTDLKLTF